MIGTSASRARFVLVCAALGSTACAAAVGPEPTASPFESPATFRDGVLVEGSKSDGNAEIIDQSTTGITVLRASAEGMVDQFRAEQCTPIDSASMDCTDAFQARYETPALHSIIVPTAASSFECRLLRVEVVGTREVLADATGIGFHYRGYMSAESDEPRFVPGEVLAPIGDATLADGARGYVFRFLGLANCSLGSASSSEQATYELKPFVGLWDEATRTATRLWDAGPGVYGGSYVISSDAPSFDRSAEVLAPAAAE
jgi:hypothetical protein